MQERRRKIEDILDRIEKCTCEADLIKLRKELDYAITFFCNKKISDLTETKINKKEGMIRKSLS